MSIDKSNSSCSTDEINPSCSISYPADEKDDWIVDELFFPEITGTRNNGSKKVGELRIHKPTKEVRMKWESEDWVIWKYDDETMMNWRLEDPEMDQHNWNVLHCAIVMGSKETVKWLIEHADFNIQESLALDAVDETDLVTAAIFSSKIETLKYLKSVDETLFKTIDIQRGVIALDDDDDDDDDDDYDDCDITFLCLAIYSSTKETVQYLLEDIKVDIKDTSYKGRNCVLTAARTDKLEILKYLHSIDQTLIMARDHDGDTALCLAGRNASKETVEYLITELKVDIHETGHLGYNCLLAAITRDKIDNVIYLNSIDPLLIEAKSEIDETAWNVAVEYKSEHSVKFLINRPFLDESAVPFDDEESCVICFDALPCVIFLPCKHLVVCKNCVENCYKEFLNCPMCKSKIDFVYTVEESDSKKVGRLEKEMTVKDKEIVDLGEKVRRLKLETDEKDVKIAELTELLSKIGLLLKENKNSNEDKAR